MKIFSWLIVFLAAIAVLAPAGSSAQYGYYGPSFNYRSTVTGTGVRQTGQYVYEISGQKSYFNTDESVFFLTRIFNIARADRFQFKHEVRSAGYTKDVFSPVYYPRRNWWAEIYYWDELGRLPAGSYEIRSYVSLDGGSYMHQRTVNFTVSTSNSGYYYPDYPDYYPIYDYYRPSNYNYNFTQIGRNIRQTGQYSYEIVDSSSSFRANENVFALAKISNITGIDSFQVKFDIYLDGNSFYRSNEPAALYPRGQRWESNYSWGNLGQLPAGYHEIRTSIRINNGSYVKLNSQRISIDRTDSYYDGRYDRDRRDTGRGCWNGDRYDGWRGGDRCHDYRREPSYKHSWTRVNTDVSYRGGYDYDMPQTRSSFESNERVKVLTKISDIKEVNAFRVRHTLYRGSSQVREITSDERRPNYNYWGYNYTQSDFGQLSSGDYTVRTYISVNGGDYKQLASVNFNVKNRRYGTDSGHYWRNDNNYDYNRYYSPTWNYWNNNSSGCTGYYSCQDQGYNYSYHRW